MLFTYAPNAVLDPSTGEPVLLGTGRVYMPGDTSFTDPIVVTLPSGVQTTEVKVANGASETFSLEGAMAVIWVDDENPSLATALQPVLPGIPPGGAVGQVLSKTTASDYDIDWIDPPAGTGGEGDGAGGDDVNRVDYASGSMASRPTSDPGVLVIWIADSPPVNALVGDIWINAPS